MNLLFLLKSLESANICVANVSSFYHYR